MTTIVYFEGLFSACIRTQLIPRLNCIPDGYNWYQRGPADLLLDGKLIVVGHSLGGPAALRWCNDYGKPIDLLVTMDARVFNQPYVKPKNVQHAVNFRRTAWWMHGYPVAGAEERIVTCGHTQIPSLPEVRELILDFL